MKLSNSKNQKENAPQEKHKKENGRSLLTTKAHCHSIFSNE